MDYFSVLCEKEEGGLLEDIVLRLENVDKHDTKKIRKSMIGIMAKVNMTKRSV
ncbi:hypothetical protein ACMDXZ_002372 [Enterococcus faecalis]